MALRIFGIFLIVAGCLDICATIWHLVDMLKNKRIWCGTDDAMQVFVFPVGIFFIATGIYLLSQ